MDAPTLANVLLGLAAVGIAAERVVVWVRARRAPPMPAAPTSRTWRRTVRRVQADGSTDVPEVYEITDDYGPK